MKNITRLLCLTLIAVMLCTSLVACAKVKGAYATEIDLVVNKTKVIYDFKSASKVELTIENTTITGSVTSNTYEGEYEIVEKDDGMQITFTFGDDETKEYAGTKTFSIDKENSTIKIGLITYTKIEK